MLEILMPHLQKRLFSDEWVQKESAILALGAVAEGE
jgi:transportin-1